MEIEREKARGRSDSAERYYREVARREGRLLQYLDNDEDTVRLIKTYTGRAIATYELAAENEKNAALG